ncbi:MAG TPA: cobalamin-independent methionine synthase II family protein [Acidimicrobiales bacterium]|nr:cobalamin-independent methionine synthase II family protein [Acidimicrobiales bacterium]
MAEMHRAHHVGSLLRPAALREAWRNAAPDDLCGAQDGAISDVVAMQEQLGLHVVNDGEFRRLSYWNRFVEQVDGLEVGEARFSFTDDSGDRLAFTAPHVTGRVHRTAPIAGHEVEFVRGLTDRDIKVTLPSPSTMQFWFGPLSGVYDSSSAFFADLAAVYREEIADLASKGADIVQLDEVALAMLCDSAAREIVAAQGEDPEALVDDYVAAIASAVRDAPANVTTAMHVCRGNYKGHWMASGGYEPVAEKVFGHSGVEMLFLEFDNERSGGFEPLRHVPATTIVVLGLVSSKTPVLETRDDLLLRIEEASKVLPVERLALSPQCGFASTIGGNALSEDDEKRKLARIVEVCDEVWGSA